MTEIDLSALPIVDDHCHPLLADPWNVSREEILALSSESRPGTMDAHVSETAYHRRLVRDLAREVGTGETLEAVLDRRRVLGDRLAATVAARRIEAVLVDTGYPPGAMSLAEMARVLPCAVHEIVRVESIAEHLLAESIGAADFLEAFRAELTRAAGRAVALKSIIAYRSGLAVRSWRPAEVRQAHRDARDRFERTGTARLVEKRLLDTLFAITLDVARDTGRPLQIHSGFGDPDIDLVLANPLLLRPIVEDERWRDVRLVLLHLAYPYAREAAFMTAVWPQPHLDLSLALPFLGAGAAAPLIEVIALAPPSKLLYGSDLRGIPELFALSADWARQTLADTLGWLSARERWSVDEVIRVARMILADNARALYRLTAAS